MTTSRLLQPLFALLLAVFILIPTTPSQAQSAAADFPESVELDGGWRWTEWFGFFNTNSYPWFYREDSGWYYANGSADSLFMYSDKIGQWVWTEKNQWPNFVNLSTGVWSVFPAGINSSVGGGNTGGDGVSSLADTVQIGVVQANLSLGNTFEALDGEILRKMAANDVKRVRLTVHTNEEMPALTKQIKLANELGMDVSLSVLFGTESEYYNADAHFRGEGGVVSAGLLGHSGINVDRYATWVRSLFEEIKDSGAKLVEVEIGNEPNWFDFNADLPVVGGGDVITSSTSVNDFPARVLAGAQKFGRCYTKGREASRAVFGTGVPVLMGSLTKVPDVWVSNFDGTLVEPEAWIKMMRGAFPGQNGSNTIPSVDAYGVHLYPSVAHGAESSVKSQIKGYTSRVMSPITNLTGSKPIYVTELGVSTGLESNASKRRDLFQWTFEALVSEPGVRDINWRTFYIYSWSDGEWGIAPDNNTTSVVDIFDLFPF